MRLRHLYKPTLLLSLITLLSSFVYYSYSKQTQNQPANLKIIYNVQLNDSCANYEVFSMNTDGTEKKNLSKWKGADWAYATFGNKIYFVSDRDSTSRWWFLYEMDVNGNNVRRVSNMRLQDSYVSVNSSGKQIIISPYIKEKKWFFILDIKSGKIMDTIIVPLANIADPCYLPGDSKIVFRGAKEKKGIEDLFIMNLDGSGLKQLTNYPKADTTAKWYETHSGTPVWNNKQKLISYFSKQKGNHSIHTVKPDGTEAKKITDDKMNEGWHAWSPDGKFIVFDGSDLEDKNFDIYIMKFDGTDIKRLTRDSLIEQAPLFIQYKN